MAEPSASWASWGVVGVVGVVGAVGAVTVERPDDALSFLSLPLLEHNVVEVLSRPAGVDDLHLDPQRVLVVSTDVVDHALLRGGREREHRGHPFAGVAFVNEARDVAVVRSEVVSPLRDAVRLIQHPCADHPLLERPSDRAAAQRLRREQHDAGFARSHLCERVCPFGRRQHPVDGHRAVDPLCPHACDLVVHECHQRRDHHGQLCTPRVARERG